MTLRDFRESDLEPFFEMDQACFAPVIAYSRAQFRSILRKPNRIGIVAERDDGRMAGFLLAENKVRKRKRTGHLVTIDVDPGMRREGIGGALMRALEVRLSAGGAESLLLEVAERNVSAYRFYSRLGYVPTGRFARYYPDGDGAIVMEKALR